jgi:hypothetical protein
LSVALSLVRLVFLFAYRDKKLSVSCAVFRAPLRKALISVVHKDDVAFLWAGPLHPLRDRVEAIPQPQAPVAGVVKTPPLHSLKQTVEYTAATA